MDVACFGAAVVTRSGIEDGPRVRAAIRGILVGLAGQQRIPWARLHHALPPELFGALILADGFAPADPRDVCRRVSASSGLDERAVLTLARSVLAVVAMRLGPDGHRELSGFLSPLWADLSAAQGK